MHRVAGVWAGEGCATVTSILILTVVREKTKTDHRTYLSATPSYDPA